jgi:DinB superfamily/SCP-2 sterol transfer family
MTASRDELVGALDDLWDCLDGLYDSLSDAEWRRKHGDDWVMSDVPFHIAYFDRELVLGAIQRGLDVPESDRRSLLTPRAIDDWNAEEFARRAPGQTGPQALSELRDVRAQIHGLLEEMTDEDLERPVWIPLAGLGERSVRTALLSCVMHTWSELMQLRIRLKRKQSMPEATTTHMALDGFFHFMPMGLNAEAAQGREFKARFSIEGAGGGSWLIDVDDGHAETSEDVETPANLTMTMKPDGFAKMWNEMQNPMLMMLTRQIRVRGLRHMGTFGKLFPLGDRDAEMRPELAAL